MSATVQVFGRRHDEASQMLMRPASEKRQGRFLSFLLFDRCRRLSSAPT
jgi:hypothetical protein